MAGEFRPWEGGEAQEMFYLEEELHQIGRVELYGGSEDRHVTNCRSSERIPAKKNGFNSQFSIKISENKFRK